MTSRRAVLAAAAALGLPAGRTDAALPQDRWPGVAAAYALGLDGELIWGAALDAPRAPASLAKLLTALALLDDGWAPDAAITVSPAAARAVGTRLGLRSGEQMQADAALTAMLVGSANDACRALVEHAAGDVKAFRPRLAAAAQRLGLTASVFVDPCGLDAPGQRTTAREMLHLATAAQAHPEIARRSGLAAAQMRTLGGREIAVVNTNALIGRLPEAVGLKSGYTAAAGRCLIAIGERGRRRATLVMLGATPERWWNASGMLTHALSLAHAPR